MIVFFFLFFSKNVNKKINIATVSVYNFLLNVYNIVLMIMIICFIKYIKKDESLGFWNTIMLLYYVIFFLFLQRLWLAYFNQIKMLTFHSS